MDKIDSIISTRYSSPDVFKPVIALSFFVKWKRDCGERNETMIDLLNNALTEIGYQEPTQTGSL